MSFSSKRTSLKESQDVIVFDMGRDELDKFLFSSLFFVDVSFLFQPQGGVYNMASRFS